MNLKEQLFTKRNIKRNICYIITLFILIAIFYLSGQNSKISGDNSLSIVTKIFNKLLNKGFDLRKLKDINNVFREFMHYAIFAVLGVFLYGSYIYTFNIKIKKIESFAICLIIIVLCAIFDEIHQYFVPGRAPQVVDVGIDTLGGICGMLFTLILYVLKNLLFKKKEKVA